ncbi:hypothetical protein EV363DRAFT_1334567 [Boletus edulis]|nr:hypothetical protein EV363DRAFT_1334567 [Boletus edulis]
MAKSVAHVGNGDKDKGYRTCDIAFEHFHSSHVTFLLLIKVCYYRVYGRGTHQCDIPFRRPHCYRPLQLSVLYGPGMCMSCYHATNMAINTSKRHTLLGCSHMQRTRTTRLSVFCPLHSPWLHLTWSRARSDRKSSYNLKGTAGNVPLSNACIASMILYALL